MKQVESDPEMLQVIELRLKTLPDLKIFCEKSVRFSGKSRQ